MAVALIIFATCSCNILLTAKFCSNILNIFQLQLLTIPLIIIPTNLTKLWIVVKTKKCLFTWTLCTTAWPVDETTAILKITW